MDFLDQFCSEDVINDWTKIRQETESSEEYEAIQQIIANVCCQKVELFDAGKQVEHLNSRQKLTFPPFLMKFVNIFTSLPENEKNYASAMFFLKVIDANSESPENPIDFSEYESFIDMFRMAADIAVKDLLENAANLYPKDGKRREIKARDLLDSEILCDDPGASIFREKAFLKMKEKLMKVCGDQVPVFERKLFENDVKGITMFPALNGQIHQNN